MSSRAVGSGLVVPMPTFWAKFTGFVQRIAESQRVVVSMWSCCRRDACVVWVVVMVVWDLGWWLLNKVKGFWGIFGFWGRWGVGRWFAGGYGAVRRHNPLQTSAQRPNAPKPKNQSNPP